MKPEVVDRQVLVITFDETGIVEGTKTFGMADAQEIEPVERETPTEGRDLTLIQQLFGNIGRFSSPMSNGAEAQRTKGPGSRALPGQIGRATCRDRVCQDA